MSELPIGEVARRTGLRPSAIRYYEQCRLIAPAGRTGGKRRYDAKAVDRLALIAFAQSAGFTLAEIKRLLSGFREDVAAGDRWRALAETKLEELERASARIEAMRAILKRAMRCGCLDLDQCAKAIAAARR
jgi:MerR family transcriptional regulator, redox-sensitive transcriptional activator SoxR